MFFSRCGLLVVFFGCLVLVGVIPMRIGGSQPYLTAINALSNYYFNDQSTMESLTFLRTTNQALVKVVILDAPLMIIHILWPPVWLLCCTDWCRHNCSVDKCRYNAILIRCLDLSNGNQKKWSWGENVTDCTEGLKVCT